MEENKNGEKAQGIENSQNEMMTQEEEINFIKNLTPEEKVDFVVNYLKKPFLTEKDEINLVDKFFETKEKIFLVKKLFNEEPIASMINYLAVRLEENVPTQEEALEDHVWREINFIQALFRGIDEYESLTRLDDSILFEKCAKPFRDEIKIFCEKLELPEVLLKNVDVLKNFSKEEVKKAVKSTYSVIKILRPSKEDMDNAVLGVVETSLFSAFINHLTFRHFREETPERERLREFEKAFRSNPTGAVMEYIIHHLNSEIS